MVLFMTVSAHEEIFSDFQSFLCDSAPLCAKGPISCLEAKVLKDIPLSKVPQVQRAAIVWNAHK